jgi:hypothetical protein
LEPDAAPPVPDAAPPAPDAASMGPDFGPPGDSTTPPPPDQGTEAPSDGGAPPDDAVADPRPQPDSGAGADGRMNSGESMDAGMAPSRAAAAEAGCQLALRSSPGRGAWLGAVLLIGLVRRRRRAPAP